MMSVKSLITLGPGGGGGQGGYEPALLANVKLGQNCQQQAKSLFENKGIDQKICLFT
jgi:hypothetical protein